MSKLTSDLSVVTYVVNLDTSRGTNSRNRCAGLIDWGAFGGFISSHLHDLDEIGEASA